MSETMRRYLDNLVVRCRETGQVTLPYATCTAIGWAVKGDDRLSVFSTGRDVTGWPFMKVRLRQKSE